MWSFLSEVKICAMRDTCAGTRASDEPDSGPRPITMLQSSGREMESGRAAHVHRARGQLSEHLTSQSQLPGDFFHRLAALAVGDVRVAQRIQNRSWTEPRSLLDDRRAALRFRFVWQCIKMDPADRAQRDRIHQAWRILDGCDQQAFLHTYSHGPPTPDFFINIIMPTKLVSTEHAHQDLNDPRLRADQVVALTSRAAPVVSSHGGPDGDMLAELETAKQAARVACFLEIASHLDTFVLQHPFATYEEWIIELHPESKRANDSWGAPTIDYRYYLEDSDHRVLWNAKVGPQHTAQVRKPVSDPPERIFEITV